MIHLCISTIFRKIRNYPIVAACLLVGDSVFGQSDSSKPSSLEEVVVTGQYQQQSVKNSIYQVRVINSDRIKKQAATKLQDVLSNELNIRFTQDMATGGSNITMLGLSGQNVKILIDGIPMVGRQGTSNEININQIDVNSIERIEIVEGPMSVVYGADALAGVINIITRKPKTEKYFIKAGIHEETAGKEYGIDQGIHNQYINLGANYKSWQFSGGFGHNLFGGWRGDTTGRELTWNKKDQLLANARIGYHNKRFSIYYRFDGLDEIITNPGNFNGSQPAIDQEYITDRVMQQAQASYLFNSQFSTQAQASHTWYARQVYSTLVKPDGDVRVATADGLHSLSTFYGTTVRASAVYKPSRVISIQPGVDLNFETGEGERIKEGVQKINDYAFYASAEITPNSWINIRPGVRIISNSVYDAPPAVPSINTKFVFSKEIDLRLAYARGFRAPSIRELYFDFNDANHSITGNPDLKAEHSNSFTGSLNWKISRLKNIDLSTQLSGFYNDVKDRIDYGTTNPATQELTYINIGTYKTRGFSIGGKVVYKSFQANAGFGLTYYYNQLHEEKSDLPSFTHSPEVNAGISWALEKLRANINFFYKYTGKRPYYQLVSNGGQQEYQLAQTEGYNWADLTFSKEIGKMITLTAGIRNLFDVTTLNSTIAGSAHTSGGTNYAGYGRSLLAAIAFNLSKK